MTTKTKNGILGRFVNYQTAQSFCNRTVKMSSIMLGDDSRYWVVTLATMQTLERDGFERAW